MGYIQNSEKFSEKDLLTIQGLAFWCGCIFWRHSRAYHTVCWAQDTPVFGVTTLLYGLRHLQATSRLWDCPLADCCALCC